LFLRQLIDVAVVADGGSIVMARKLSVELGFACGISSGATFLGALMAMEQLGKEAIVATVFADDNKKYLSTDLVREQPTKPEYLSPHVRLFGYQTIGRGQAAIGASSDSIA